LFHDSLSLLNAQEPKILELFSPDGCSSKLCLAVERVWLFQIGFWLLSKWWSLVVVVVPVIFSSPSNALLCFHHFDFPALLWSVGGCSNVFDSWWLFRRTLRCRTHRDDSRPASASTVNLFQAALVHPVSSPLKSIRHRLSNEPPTSVEDDGSLAADDSNNYILESSGIFFPGGVFNLYKPSLREILRRRSAPRRRRWIFL
jgi:hypothetical protein